MKPASVVPWADLRAVYIREGGRSLKAFAEQHDAPYHSLLRRAKREGWRHLHRLAHSRQLLRKFEADLQVARAGAGKAAARVQRVLAKPTASLKAIHNAADAAHADTSMLATYAAWVANAKEELAALEAGRERDPGDGMLAGLGWRSVYEIRAARNEARSA